MSGGGPLNGLRVLDLCRFPPGAYCTQLLAGLGADVCRLDSPGSDPARSGLGVGLTAGKRSIAVNLRHERGTEVLRRLAGWADVLVENGRPGDLDQRGFGYSHAAEQVPSLIWCSITGFGQDGPYTLWPGHDLTYSAHSGLLAALEPVAHWHPQMMLAVPLGATMAVAGITSALYDRQRTGQGCQLDISLSESASWLLSGADALINGAGFSIPESPDRHLYQCSDGRYLSVAAANPRSWGALCTGLGLVDLAEKQPRQAEWPEVIARLAEVFSSRPAAEWVAELGPLGATVGILNKGSDLANDPQVVARNGLVDVDGTKLPVNPIRIRGPEARPATPPSAPPAVGAHTRAVLLEAGYDEAEVDALFAEGVASDK